MKRKFRVALTACLLVTCLAPARAESTPENSVTGLWACETSFPVGLSGELTITRLGESWQGAIAGGTAEAKATGGKVRLDFADEGGTFRGYLDADGRLDRGFWARREMLDDLRYPEGAAQAYAMPLALRAAGAGRWQAAVDPLPDPFTLYLNVFRDEKGVLKAAIRNPEHHRHGPAMQLFATLEGDRLRLGAAAEPGEGDLVATVKRTPERIEMYWEGLRRTLSLARATPAQAARFTARPRTDPRYVYRVPQVLGDGWPVARAGDLGVDEAALARAVQRIIDIDPSSARAWLIHSMAVAYKGKLILDEYFYGHGPDIPHDMRSASKTFSSVALGAAMMDGARIGPQSRLVEIVAPLGPFAFPDPRKDRITLAHVMTHTTGLACDDNADPSVAGSENVMQTQRALPDWWKFVLDLPMAHEPGARYAYCSGGISLTGAALTYGTGEWLPALFDRTVAKPLQYGSYYWNLMPTGEGYLGGGAFVRTRDFLKLGQAYLDGGVWNGRRVVTEAWVKDSIAPHVRISPETTGVSGQAFANNYYEVDEGYAWHHVWVRSFDKRYPAYHGNGNGGQLLLVVPEFDLAVMFTAGNYRQGLWNRERDDIVGEMIVPALARAGKAIQ
ncbi:MAG: serine hydrolase domain-containing protein [Gammaproteobacteria bacterium]